MPGVGFEPTIPVFERVNTVHALDRAAAVIGKIHCLGSGLDSKPTAYDTSSIPFYPLWLFMFSDLYSRKINSCGTVRRNRKSMPANFGPKM
jgi:hypothetical protein